MLDLKTMKSALEQLEAEKGIPKEKIIDAIELFARAKRGEVLPEPAAGGVGVRAARFRGADLILGRKEFVDDLVRPGMLHGAVVLSPFARARGWRR